MTYHRWVIHERVPDYLRLGWMAMPSLEGAHHGYWSAHCIWLCECKLVEPRKLAFIEAQRQLGD
jgi:hypothetical protein